MSDLTLACVTIAPRAELARVNMRRPVMKSQTPTQLRVTVTARPAVVDTLQEKEKN